MTVNQDTTFRVQVGQVFAPYEQLNWSPHSWLIVERVVGDKAYVVDPYRGRVGKS